eukprot:g7347.t1
MRSQLYHMDAEEDAVVQTLRGSENLNNERNVYLYGRRSLDTPVATKRPDVKLALVPAILSHLGRDSWQDCKTRLNLARNRRNGMTRASVDVKTHSTQKGKRSTFYKKHVEEKQSNDGMIVTTRLMNCKRGNDEMFHVLKRPKNGLEEIGVEEKEFRAQLRTLNEIHLSDAQLRNMSIVERNFCFVETIQEKKSSINILEGIQLWKNFITESEEANLLTLIYEWEKKGEDGELKGATFAAPKKWKRGKGRRTIQFGCCYNYADNRTGRSPGILDDEVVEDMPSVLCAIAERLVRWNVVPLSRRPDSAIVNIYNEGDCIPPHIDHGHFLRPFVTISLLSEAPISFGLNIKPLGPGEFKAPCRISLPPGSCLVLNGNGADKAKHCVTAVKKKRISITLRKMDPARA